MFGKHLEAARQAMAELAAAHDSADLYRRGFRLYENFRPSVPAGESGWDAQGELDIDAIREVVRRTRAYAPEPAVCRLFARVYRDCRLHPCRSNRSS
jgi:hypothetical protein